MTETLRDSRVRPIRRRISFEVDDYTNINFNRLDEERIAEEFEEMLQRSYDVKVDLITIETIASRDADE